MGTTIRFRNAVGLGYAARVIVFHDRHGGSVHHILENVERVVDVGQVGLAGVLSVAPYLQKDTGKSISRLISLSHNHLLSTIVVVFLLVFVFSFSSFPDWLKMVLYILAFSAIVLDIGSWWLAKLAPSHAVLVIVGGVLLGTSFGALTLLGLWDTWFGKEE